jgi:ABC-type multidrug transport system fused ATPase/permease subunit
VRTFPDADPGTPDIRGPWRYLLWTAGRFWRVLVLDFVCNVLWVGGQVLTPAAIGEAVSAGLVGKNQAALIWWGLAVLGLGIVQAVFAMFVERYECVARIGGGYQTMQFVTRKACDLGATIGKRVSAGDLVTVGVSDINLIGQALEVGVRGVAGVVGFAAVAVLMLVASWKVGLLVLVAVPVILFAATRLSRLLRERQREVRARQRELADQALDIVRGLRVLRGLGGEAIFAGKYRDGSQKLRFTELDQARVAALLGAATTFLPGLLLTGVVALSGELVLARQLSAGQMVAFYGYATFLVLPINRMTYGVSKVMQAHVAAANVTRLLRLEPDIGPEADPAAGPDAQTGPDSGLANPDSGLEDPDSGLLVPARGLTAVVCSADRLGRYSESGVTYAGRPLAALPLADVRKRILVATGDARLFAGPLRRELDPAGRLDGSDEPLWTAVDAAAARDIIEALPDQFDTSVAAGGQGFSGGQQQRLRLVRALMADPEVLILIDPTSAVDAHTESKMAAGIARLRRDRATVVFTTSILLLHQADHVALVIDGTVAAEGSHESLLADARYRSVVERGMAAA